MKFLKLIRVHNGVIGSLGILVSALCLPNFPNLKEVILGMLSITFFILAGNIQNDLLDIETDKLSHPNRVLVTNTFSLKWLTTLYILFYILGLILSHLVSPIHGLLGLLIVLLLTLYNYRFKNLNLLGNFSVAFLSAIPLFYMEWPSIYLTLLPFLFALLTSFIREIIKDTQDMSGDILAQRKTFPILFGIPPTKILLTLLFILLISLLYIPHFILRYHVSFLIISLVFIIPTLITCSVFVLRNNPNWKVAQQIIKVVMLEGIVAISLGVSLN